MTTVRRVIREKAFQSLFQLSTNTDLTKEMAIQQALEIDLDSEDELSAEEAMKSCLPKGKNGKDIVTDALQYLNVLVSGVSEKQADIDAVISKQLKKGWSLSRLERTNLLILRLASYELLYQEEIDPRIVMNEAIELTKEFNDEKSSKFINGVLQSIENTKEA